MFYQVCEKENQKNITFLNKQTNKKAQKQNTKYNENISQPLTDIHVLFYKDKQKKKLLKIASNEINKSL